MHYSGDGELFDNGLSAATDRYVLDLGEIPLERQVSKTFHFSGLPTTSFVIGFEIEVTPEFENAIAARDISPTVSIELRGTSNERLIHDNSELRTWTWSVPSGGLHAFVYRRDDPRTFFTAKAEIEYALQVIVVEADKSGAGYSARVQLKSGGWK